MVRQASTAGGQLSPQEADGSIAPDNLTEELARLLAATIAQGQQGKRLQGVATGSELASLAALVSASQNQRTAQPSFRDGLSSLHYTPPAQSLAPTPSHTPGSIHAPAPSHAPSGSGLLVSEHHDDEPMPIPSTWRQPVNSDDERWYRQQVGAAALGLLAGLIVVVPAVLWLSGWLGGPQTKAGRQPVADQATTIKVADVKTVRVIPVEKTENASQYVAASVDPRQTAVGPQASAAEKPPVVVPPPPAAVMAPPPKVYEPPRPRVEDLVAEARQRISIGDMLGARSMLTNAQDLAPGPIAFALAETYDPNMLASWQTRGIPAEPEKAKALYIRAREFGDSRAQQRIDWLLGR